MKDHGSLATPPELWAVGDIGTSFRLEVLVQGAEVRGISRKMEKQFPQNRFSVKKNICSVRRDKDKLHPIEVQRLHVG